MEKIYKVTLTFYKQEFTINANTPTEAKEKAEERYFKNLGKARVASKRAKQI